MRSDSAPCARGCVVHPENFDGLRHPIERGRFEIYALAAGIEDLDRADQQYLEVMLRRRAGESRSGHALGRPRRSGLGRGLLLAMDAAQQEGRQWRSRRAAHNLCQRPGERRRGRDRRSQRSCGTSEASRCRGGSQSQGRKEDASSSRRRRATRRCEKDKVRLG